MKSMSKYTKYWANTYMLCIYIHWIWGYYRSKTIRKWIRISSYNVCDQKFFLMWRGYTCIHKQRMRHWKLSWGVKGFYMYNRGSIFKLLPDIRPLNVFSHFRSYLFSRWIWFFAYNHMTMARNTFFGKLKHYRLVVKIAH